MNNSQFRNLLLSNAQKKDGSAGSPSTSRPGTTPALGSRKTSAIPMTPRQVGRNHVQSEFARQLAEKNGKSNNPTKKFKSSAPKGVKLVAGYVDRTEARREAEGKEAESETATRIKKLEEAMKLGQIDRDMFEKLVLEITDGDISQTHLVKGLDRKLLERVRKGEDITAIPEGDREEEVDDELDAYENQAIEAVVKDRAEKKGEMAPPAPPQPVAGVKRSRNDILTELKAQRKAAAEAAEAEHAKKYPTLGLGFRKVGPGGESTRIEVDSRGREVLVITDADGKEKRKVRKQKAPESEPERRYDIEDPNKPLHINMESVKPTPKEDEGDDDDDDDIFEGVGSTYNPLADIEDSDDGLSEEEGAEKTPENAKNAARVESGSEEDGEERSSKLESDTSAKPSAPAPKRNWFGDTAASQDVEKDVADATVRAALAKVRHLDASSSLLADTEEARLKKRAAELAAGDRDMDDMDMDFGSSRYGDAEEMEREGEKVKFSEWRGMGEGDDDEDNGGGERSGKKRKRGPKKKKGDKNSAADVLSVVERQKGAKSLG